jgi:predicted HicB family RNase H-like nuclease
VTSGKPAPANHEVRLNARMNPELHRQLKSTAALEGLSIQDWLHERLCRELGRPDLLHRAPGPAPSAN